MIEIKTSVEKKNFGNMFKLTVTDKGEGIKPEYIDMIYKPFFTTKDSKGTGMGLAAVRQVVLEFGGFIEVKSTPGEGTTFTVFFAESK